MSLITDQVFYNALRQNADLMAMVGGRIENTSIPVPDDDLANQPLPYIIITYDGMQNEGFTKDDDYEGNVDKVQIGIEAAASDRETLGEIMKSVRATVKEYFANAEEGSDDYDLVPFNYALKATPVAYDSLVPCYYQTLQYECDTNTE
jgi:hypothetical protein